VKYFYDTEFLEDGHTIDLISIGIVAEDGREYYAVSLDTDWHRVAEHEWLAVNVLPSLPRMFEGPEWKTRDQISFEVRQFITGDRRDNELWAYYSAYDHVALCQLFGRMIDLPPSVPMFSHDIKAEADRLQAYPLPVQDTGHHNALEDARWNKRAHEHLFPRV